MDRENDCTLITDPSPTPRLPPDGLVIQELLGHADLKSTQVYARGVSATHVQALDRLHADDARRYNQQAEQGRGAEGIAEAEVVAPNRGSESDAA